MLLDAARYYDMYLCGKEKEIIIGELNKLKGEILRLKRKMEMPAYFYESHPFPSEKDQIAACREYIKAANRALLELGEPVPMSEEERAALFIESNNSKIKKMTLTLGNYLDKKYELFLEGEAAELHTTELHGRTASEHIDTAEVRAALSELRLGEWRDSYMPEHYGCALNEPVRWQLRVDYEGGIPPRFYDGAGIFPYNFSVLCDLMRADY